METLNKLPVPKTKNRKKPRTLELPPRTRRIQEYAILEEVKLVLFLLISNEVDHYVHP